MIRNLYYQTATLFLIGLLLAGVTVIILRVPLSTSPILTERGILPVEKGQAQVDMPENLTGALAEIQARPLFWKSRRPYRASTPQITESDPPPAEIKSNVPAETFILKGVFLRPPLSKALIVSPANPDGIWVAHGGDIEGWKIEEVAASEIRLAQQQKTTVLRLYSKQE